jgi:hypothetical protein
VYPEIWCNRRKKKPKKKLKIKKKSTVEEEVYAIAIGGAWVMGQKYN